VSVALFVALVAGSTFALGIAALLIAWRINFPRERASADAHPVDMLLASRSSWEDVEEQERTDNQHD
jgi:hypothetical protein